MKFTDLFTATKPVIACIHLEPLPGSPLYEGSMENVIETALLEADIFKKHKIDGIIVENFRDMPFYPDNLPAETIAAMTSVTYEIVKVFPGPVGVNALRNDATAAMAIAVATGARFIRVNIHTGAAITDQGVIQGKAYETLRLRTSLKSDVLIFADVNVKHATQLGNRSIALETRDLTDRGLADAIIVSGDLTGAEAKTEDIKEVRLNTHLPIILGSGATPENLKKLLPIIDSLIVGSFFKDEGKASNNVNKERVTIFMETKKTLSQV